MLCSAAVLTSFLLFLHRDYSNPVSCIRDIYKIGLLQKAADGLFTEVHVTPQYEAEAYLSITSSILVILTLELFFFLAVVLIVNIMTAVCLNYITALHVSLCV